MAGNANITIRYHGKMINSLNLSTLIFRTLQYSSELYIVMHCLHMVSSTADFRCSTVLDCDRPSGVPYLTPVISDDKVFFQKCKKGNRWSPLVYFRYSKGT